jgi:hypothetical protein
MPLSYNSKGWTKNDLVVNIVTHVYKQYKDQKRGVSAERVRHGSLRVAT